MKIVLHVGLHKTGTSALQQFLHQNSASLDRHGVSYYVPQPLENNHHQFALLFQNATKDPTQALSTSSQILDRASNEGCHTAIISSEIFCEYGTDVDLVKTAFAGNDLNIIAYIRRPDETFFSAYSQLITEFRTRRTSRIDEMPEPYELCYSKLLKPWLDSFPPGNLILCPYDFDQMLNGSLFDDFLRQIGIEVDKTFDKSIPETRANLSLPFSLLEFLRLSNHVAIDEATHSELVALLYKTWLQNKSTFPLRPAGILTEQQVKRIYAKTASDLPNLMPYLRSGFQTNFLVEPRETLPDRAEGDLAIKALPMLLGLSIQANAERFQEYTETVAKGLQAYVSGVNEFKAHLEMQVEELRQAVEQQLAQLTVEVRGEMDDIRKCNDDRLRALKEPVRGDPH